jgi:hypothetical protein
MQKNSITDHFSAKSENCEVICETKVSGNRRNFAA